MTMRGGTQTTQTQSHAKPPDGGTTKKPTAEQIRYAQLLGNEDTRRLQEQIKMVADVTGHSHDEVSVALHDCNFDTEQTINTLLEGRLDQSEWIVPTSRKKKHQSAGPGIDNIIPTSAPPSAQTASKPRQTRGGGRNSGKGRQERQAEGTDGVKSNGSNGLSNHDKPAVEGGRGRGTKDDRYGERRPGGRGGGPRRGGRGGGRPGRPFRSRGNRFGSGNRSAPSANVSSNGPAENGTEMWDIPDDSSKENKTGTDWGEEPVIDNWTPGEWSSVPSVEAPASVPKDSLLKDSEQLSSNSWADSKDDEQVSWDTGPAVPESKPSNSHTAPEKHDVAIIMSKLAQSSSPGKVPMPQTERVPHILLPGENHSSHVDHLNRLLDKAGLPATFPSPEPQQAQPQPQPQPQSRPQPQSQRQPKQVRQRKAQRSQIPVQAVEMPGAMADSLDVQFGNLEFGGDSGSGIQEKEVKIKTRSNDTSPQTTEEALKSEASETITPTAPVEPKPDLPSLSSSLPVNPPATVAATTPATSSITALEETSPRHYQHAAPQEQRQPLVSKGPPDPIPLPPQMESHMESVLQPKSVPSSIDRPKTPPSLQSVQSISSPSRGQNKVQHIPTVLSKDSPLEPRAYQHGVCQSSLNRKEQISTGSLGSSSYSSSSGSNNLSRSELSSSSEPLAPPPGVGILHSASSTTSAPSALTNVTMSNSGKPLPHTSKPSLPPGVLPINPAMYGMPLHYPVGIPPYYDDVPRMQMPYYEMTSFAPQGRDNLPGTYPGDQKFGRSDASSPVPTSLNQGGSAGQPHLQQQQYINAAMPPFGYGGLAFYPPGTNPMMGAFPTFATQMYQMPAKTHASGSQYQPAFSGQHGSHSFSSGYDDLGTGHDFGKSGYHSSVSQSQNKSNAGSAVTSSSDLPGNTYKGQVGKFGDSKSFLAGTPPPALSHPMAGQHGHMGSFAHTGHPFMPMIPPAQQPHHPSLFHQHQQQHHHMTHQHLDASQGGTTQRGQQASGLKQSQNKGHQGSAGYPGFWSGQN